LVAGLVAAFGGAGAAEPTIEEMLKEARAMAAKEGPATGPASGEQLPESEYLKNMKARLQYEVDQRARNFDKRRDSVGMGDLCFDLQQFDKALAAWSAAVQKPSNDWQIQGGYVHQRLTRLYTLLGQNELGTQALEEASKRMPGPWAVHDIDRLKGWLKDYPAHDEELKDLKAKVAADPKDANSRWKLLLLYREDVPMRLDEFVGLMQFRDLYPTDPRVTTTGECEWRLMELMMHFGITDEGLKMAEKFREKFPKSGISTNGDATFRLGEYYTWLARPQDAINQYKELREKYPKHWASGNGEAPWRIGELYKGLKRWQDAMDCYKEVREKYNKHWTCNPPPNQQATIQERIFEMSKNGAR
jgi:tetratricopeptide (TPR) repeat protein